MTECPGCGAPWREGARFCGRCGQGRDGSAAPREELGAVGPRGLKFALVTYFLTLTWLVVHIVGDWGTFASIIGYGVMFGVGLVAGGALGRESLALYRLPRLGLKEVGMAALSLLWVVALIYGTVTLLPSLYADPMVEFREEGRGIAYTLFAVAVCPAVVEELLFRGVILTGLRGVFNTRIAVVVSGMMFATIHLSVISFVSHSLLGIIFGALCVRSRSLWPSMIAHAAWNAGWVLWG